MTKFVRFCANATGAVVMMFAPPATAADVAPAAKLDAALTAFVQGGSTSIGSGHLLLHQEPGRAQPLIQTLLRFEGSLDEVVAQGAVVRSVLGTIATVDIPADKLMAVAALPGVISIESARSTVLRSPCQRGRDSR